MTPTPSPTNASPTRPPRVHFHTLLVFRCPTELSESLAAFAARHDKTLSAAIRELLLNGLGDR
jgi:hypothetical protein